MSFKTRAFLISIFILSCAGAYAVVKSMGTTRAEVIPSRDKLDLINPGTLGPVDYSKYGEFTNEGTDDYRYVIKDKLGLGRAIGEGMFPNQDVKKNPQYLKYVKDGLLQGNHWDFVDTPYNARNFYKWATTSEDPGAKQYYTAIALERAGYIEQAIKGFYAVAVHFPKTFSWTYYRTPWYVSPSSLDRAEQLLRRHPHVKMQLKGAHYSMINTYDNDVANDKYKINPGRLVAVKNNGKEKHINLAKLSVVKTIGGPAVQLKKYANGHWQLFVDNKPFFIKGLSYLVCPVGLSPDCGTWNVARDWQLLDTNQNGIHDSFFESFVDSNNNNEQDPDEPTVGDAKLIKDMGINVLRAYHHLYNKPLFRKLYDEYGIRVLCGDLLGVYAVGSGADWHAGTDYENPEQQKTMLASVRAMVEEYKDEPYVLIWVLGNENVFGVANNSNTKPEAFFKFVNRAAQLVHQLDPTRPVAYANGDLLFLDVFAANCPDVDIFGANAYRGEQGFGRQLFLNVKEFTGKPVMITEFGASAFAEGYSRAEADDYQAMYLRNNFEDLSAHRAGSGEGNVLGGVFFEWVDEWWKANADLPEYVQKSKAAWYAPKSDNYKNLNPNRQDVVPQFGFPFLDGWSYEEWLGIISVGDGRNSPFVRQLRPAYSALKDVLND